jgi:DNA-binding transcriptional ArsR family regulator
VTVFEALGDANRRRMLELLSTDEPPAGALAAPLGISQPAVSQHLKVLREAGLVGVRVHGRQWLYALDPDGVARARAWLAGLDPLAGFQQPLDALATEVARGRRPGSSRGISPFGTAELRRTVEG